MKDRVWDTWRKGTSRIQVEPADFSSRHGQYENCETIYSHHVGSRWQMQEKARIHYNKVMEETLLNTFASF